MSEDELKATLAKWEGTRFSDDARALVAEVRRLQRQLGEAVAANLCHVSLKADEMLAVEVKVLRDHVDRLRELIASVEEVDNDFGTMFCPWCVGCKGDHSDGSRTRACPAFTPDGKVR